MFLLTWELVSSEIWSVRLQVPTLNKGHAAAIGCHYQLMSAQWPLSEQSVASSQSLLEVGTTISTELLQGHH